MPKVFRKRDGTRLEPLAASHYQDGMMKRSQLLDEIASRISRIQQKHPVRVAIDGVDAAGKTTMAEELVAPLKAYGRPVIRASIDGFHNPARVRHNRGAASPAGYYY